MANLTTEERGFADACVCCLPLRTIHVNVRLKGPPPWRCEWRQVKARDLSEACRVAERSNDVERCLEASLIPGGVVT